MPVCVFTDETADTVTDSRYSLSAALSGPDPSSGITECGETAGGESCHLMARRPASQAAPREYGGVRTNARTTDLQVAGEVASCETAARPRGASEGREPLVVSAEDLSAVYAMLIASSESVATIFSTVLPPGAGSLRRLSRT